MNSGTLIQQIQSGNIRALARTISIVENEAMGYQQIMTLLVAQKNVPVIGITGPPGAGKSTLVNGLVAHLTEQDFKIAIIAVDPTSPFNFGALLGDRIRLNEHYNNPNVFIRSLATRGSLGGLSDKIIEIVEVVKAAQFDYIFVETVGVGQSEVEIAGLADTTIVTMVPEAGDEIQTMKAGLMEIADIFVVNKSDRPAADQFAKNLRKLVHGRPKSDWHIPVQKVTATKKEGIPELIEHLHAHTKANLTNSRRAFLITKKAVQLIQKHRMSDIDQAQLYKTIQNKLLREPYFNLYGFLKQQGFLEEWKNGRVE